MTIGNDDTGRNNLEYLQRIAKDQGYLTLGDVYKLIFLERYKVSYDVTLDSFTVSYEDFMRKNDVVTIDDKYIRIDESMFRSNSLFKSTVSDNIFIYICDYPERIENTFKHFLDTSDYHFVTVEQMSDFIPFRQIPNFAKYKDWKKVGWCSRSGIKKSCTDIYKLIIRMPIESLIGSSYIKSEIVKPNETINDSVSNPSHYTSGRKFEPHLVIEDWDLNFNLGNVVKYIARAGRKDDILEDLKKARQYLDFEIGRLEKGGEIV